MDKIGSLKEIFLGFRELNFSTVCNLCKIIGQCGKIHRFSHCIEGSIQFSAVLLVISFLYGLYMKLMIIFEETGYISCYRE